MIRIICSTISEAKDLINAMAYEENTECPFCHTAKIQCRKEDERFITCERCALENIEWVDREGEKYDL